MYVRDSMLSLRLAVECGKSVVIGKGSLYISGI